MKNKKYYGVEWSIKKPTHITGEIMCSRLRRLWLKERMMGIFLKEIVGHPGGKILISNSRMKWMGNVIADL